MLPSLNLGFVTLQLYPFFWGLAWGLGSYAIYSNVKKIEAAYFLVGLFVIAWIGAKYAFDLSSGNYAFSSGLGFVFYGGLIAGMLYVLLLSFFKRHLVEMLMPFLVLYLPLSHGIGRIGCYFAGCCYGSLGIPVQLIESLGLFLIFISLKLSHGRGRISVYALLSQYFLSYGALRVLLEFFREDSRGLWWRLPPSVWISIGCIMLGFFFAGVSKRRC